MAMSQLERNKLYLEKNKVKRINLILKPDEMLLIDTICKNNNIKTVKAAIINACKYCIDNDIKLFESVSDKDNKSDTD